VLRVQALCNLTEGRSLLQQDLRWAIGAGIFTGLAWWTKYNGWLPLAIEGTNCWPWLGLADAVPTWTDWHGSSSVWRFFTNCGPKNATFMVHRSGDTNDDLTVTYEVGGTATNGVDYVPLDTSLQFDKALLEYLVSRQGKR
jgi:hypothetical protein